MQLAKKCAEASNKEGATEHGEVRIDVTSKSKDERKLYHNIVKRHFPHLDSCTVDQPLDSKKFVVVSAAKKPAFTNQWPRDRPKHLTFHLCKVILVYFRGAFPFLCLNQFFRERPKTLLGLVKGQTCVAADPYINVHRIRGAGAFTDMSLP